MRALKRGSVFVQGTPRLKGHVVNQGDRVEYMSRPVRQHLAGAVPNPAGVPALEVECLYQDDHLAALLKPAGVSVQGDESAADLRRAANLMLPPPTSRPDALSHPKNVHRLVSSRTAFQPMRRRQHSALCGVLIFKALPSPCLPARQDKETSGILLFARTQSANSSLGAAFAAAGTIKKTYLALLAGLLEQDEGVVDSLVQGRPARSTWRVLDRTRSVASGWLTTVELHPETGRQHQLRRHMALEGCPILGDPRYMSERSRHAEVGELYLHAHAVELPHPATGEPLHIQSAEPKRFEARRRREVLAWEQR